LLAQAANPTAGRVKTTAELIDDVSKADDDLRPARDAIKTAVQTRQLRVLIAGLGANHFDVRSESLKALQVFSPDKQKQALIAALRDDPLWKEVYGGEENAMQIGYYREFVEMLRNLGVNANPDDLRVREARAKIAAKLRTTKSTAH
jgi:hypothetical protein